MSEAIDRLNTALEGRYHITGQIGEGGMATVYLCDDLKHERQVALKVLKPELAAVVGAERFLAEIKTTANLQHPHILPLFDSGEADSFLFYVMPYVEGETLRDRLEREKQLPVDEAVRIASDVAEALQAAHAELGAAASDQDHAAHDPRRTGDGVGRTRGRRLGLPHQLTALSRHSHEPTVERAGVDLPTIEGRTAVHDVAAHESRVSSRYHRVVCPQEFAGRGVECVRHAPRSGGI